MCVKSPFKISRVPLPANFSRDPGDPAVRKHDKNNFKFLFRDLPRRGGDLSASKLPFFGFSCGKIQKYICLKYKHKFRSYLEGYQQGG